MCRLQYSVGFSGDSHKRDTDGKYLADASSGIIPERKSQSKSSVRSNRSHRTNVAKAMRTHPDKTQAEGPTRAWKKLSNPIVM